MGSPTKGRGDPKTTKQTIDNKKTKNQGCEEARRKVEATNNKKQTIKEKTLNTKQEERRSAPSTDEGEWRKWRKVVNR